MKALANGVLNLSTLDGWWDQVNWMLGPDAHGVGWTIGRGELYENLDYQDQVEAEALYEVLEQDVVPTFYDRDQDDVPRKWIAKVKGSLERMCYYFNSHRMVREYVEKFYLPTDERFRKLSDQGMAGAKSLARWRQRVRSQWKDIKLEAVLSAAPSLASVGETVSALARVSLGALEPKDVSVELVYGPVGPDGELRETNYSEMSVTEAGKEGVYVYQGEAVAQAKSGLQGFAIRALPRHESLPTRFVPGLVTWAGAARRK
jgi:starch phosphorylase